ncbi:unnamed protein product [Dovyalis caffra]|uniref:Kinetochore protein Spc24 n=1 Tax=Dovyalis caffra TaxID=77055 RepID=A0AAV1S1R2_9ROSI|nr:unnamed protein product [Dovyalis caffra]
MGDFSVRIDVEKLISFSDDLVAILKDQRDINNLTHCLEQSKSLKSSSDAEFNDTKTLIEGADYEKKVEACKKKTEKAKSEVVSDAEMKTLQQELEAELEKEPVNNEISDLERKRISFDEQKQTVKKHEKDELRAQRMLSMYASVTNLIPELDDHSKISGHIVDRDKRAFEKFEFDPTEMSPFDTCQSIWKMIDSQ